MLWSSQIALPSEVSWLPLDLQVDNITLPFLITSAVSIRNFITIRQVPNIRLDYKYIMYFRCHISGCLVECLQCLETLVRSFILTSGYDTLDLGSAVLFFKFKTVYITEYWTYEGNSEVLRMLIEKVQRGWELFLLDVCLQMIKSDNLLCFLSFWLCRKANLSEDMAVLLPGANK